MFKHLGVWFLEPCVVFVYDGATDELMAAHTAGDNTGHFAELRIGMSQRLSGWVAANLQTIIQL